MQKTETEGGDSLIEKQIDMKKAGQILRDLRGIRTRAGVSKETGIPYSTLEAYECGTRIPSGRNKEKLANYYGVKVSDIFLPVDTAKRSGNDKKRRQL